MFLKQCMSALFGGDDRKVCKLNFILKNFFTMTPNAETKRCTKTVKCCLICMLISRNLSTVQRFLCCCHSKSNLSEVLPGLEMDTRRFPSSSARLQQSALASHYISSVTIMASLARGHETFNISKTASVSWTCPPLKESLKEMRKREESESEQGIFSLPFACPFPAAPQLRSPDPHTWNAFSF